ncbi:hypothetical protein O3M35_007336 [Rhynocoris fuscipes]|uniref:Galectin n=1 Tax=Rhynocoris fuscipes TaxID=488301 RepID=A0AAW1D922_9HEMI
MRYIFSSKYPFFHEFKYPLVERWDLTIIGTPLDNAERFTIDFCGTCNKCSKTHKNIIFHFNPRLAQNYVARNSFIHEQWGIEEKNAIKKSPFQRGKTFTLEFFLLQNKFLVSVDGKHFCDFQHRMPPSDIESFEISGDISLKRIDLALKDSYPAEQTPLYPDLNLVLEEYSVPFSYNLPGCLTVDTIIEIKGRVLLLPHEFYLNLQNGSSYYPHPVIPYHLSMRWRPLATDTTVVNSWTSGQWDEEIILPSFLRPNSNFIITIYTKREGLSTVIKAPVKPYSTVLPLFVYKSELDLINTLHIQGDVQVYSINVKKV